MDKNITIENIKELTTENYCPKNTLEISIPYDFITEAVDLNWYDILFAIGHKYLNHRGAIEHAQWKLEEEGYPQAVLNLACLTKEEAVFPHSIHPLIDELVLMENIEVVEKAEPKLIYALMKWVFENRASYEDVFEVITSICSDFLLPKSIIHFAWFREPGIGPTFGSAEENEAWIFDQWAKYLDEQEKIWKL